MHKGHISMLGSRKPLYTKPSDFLLFFRFILWIWVFWTQIQIYRQNQNLWIFFKYIIWSKTINLEMSKIDSLEICISNVLWHIFQACGSSGPLLPALGLNKHEHKIPGRIGQPATKLIFNNHSSITNKDIKLNFFFVWKIVSYRLINILFIFYFLIFF